MGPIRALQENRVDIRPPHGCRRVAFVAAPPVTAADLPAGAAPATPMTTASPSPPASAGQTAASLPTAPEPAAEPIKKAVDAVNMFRGLIGR